MHRAHHGAAPRAGRHDGAAHRVPHIHEAHRPRGIRTDAFDRCTLGPQRREIMPDAATLLHRQGCFAHMLEDRAQIVLDPAHDEAIEKRYLAARAGAGQNPPSRQEAEIRHGIIEAPGPRLLGALALLGHRGRARDTAERIRKLLLAVASGKGSQPILGAPNFLGDRSQKFRVVPHHAPSLTRALNIRTRGA